MIAVAKIKEAERLLKDGNFSQRQIARLVGISRASIGAIAAGTRPDYDERRRQRAGEVQTALGPLKRCPDCGGMVYLPCRLCRVRSLKAEEQAKAHARRRHAKEIQLAQIMGIPLHPAKHAAGPKGGRPPATKMAS